MEKEKLYTKYKFTKVEMSLLCIICKVSEEELEAKFDTMSYDEKKSVFNMLPIMESLINVTPEIFGSFTDIQR